jgi:uncharacterized protein YndB with AHSA1/START domain
VIPGASQRTQEKLESNGKVVRVGDRETGVWEVPVTHWYAYNHTYVYLTKGTRLKATWEFRPPPDVVGSGGEWRLCKLDLENLNAPRSMTRPMRMVRVSWPKLILSAFVVAALLVWVLDI